MWVRQGGRCASPCYRVLAPIPTPDDTHCTACDKPLLKQRWEESPPQRDVLQYSSHVKALHLQPTQVGWAMERERRELLRITLEPARPDRCGKRRV
jgi:hypothetical protein